MGHTAFFQKITGVDAFGTGICGHRMVVPDKVIMPAVHQHGKPQDIFFYLPSDYQREAKLKLNSVSMGTFFDGENWRIIPFGTQKVGELKLEIELKDDVLYVKDDIPMLYYLDMEVFKDVMARLAETQIVLDEEHTETHLTGTLNVTSASQTMLLTIPYDEGWHIKIDGEEIEYFEALDSLIGFHVGEGNHTIDIRYMPKAFSLGLAVSIVSLILFILIIIFEKYVFTLLFGKQNRTLGIDVSADTIALEESSDTGACEESASLNGDTSEADVGGESEEGVKTTTENDKDTGEN